MTVNVEWKTAEGGHTGLVADGTCLLDAARRHGIALPTECGGRGECDTCAVAVEAGAALLSAPTEAERVRLGAERLAAGERLACQAKAERAGDLVLRPVPQAAREETTEETARDFKEEFKRLPLRKKLATLAGLEAEMAYETLVRAVDLPFELMGKGLDLIAGRGRRLSQADRTRAKPAAEPTRPPTPGSDPGHEGPAI
ncbi:MAG: (2Fe-2S)-binding protein [Acidobacteria bacterium]|nr:(2Fe-2S)-binding protein [Acidobacteriota bacterium]